MRKMRKIFVLLLSMALILGGLQIAPEYQAMAAKKKMKLSAKKLTLKVGKKKKLKVKNKKGKVKWKSSKKKVATVSKKGVVKAKKAGKATITATVTYKKKKTKLKCKVTVVKKGKATKKPTKKPTNKPTQKPTNKPTPKITPKVPSIDVSKAVEWNVEKQGDFSISGIQFTDKTLTYQIPSDEDVVLVDTGTKASVKAVVPDLSKCAFDVLAAGKSYAQTQTGDIKWSDKSYHPNNMGHGYYTFKLYIVSDGKAYYRIFKMADKIKTTLDDGKNFTITSIQSGGKEFALSKDRADAKHYMMELSEGAANVKAMIPDMEKAKFTAAYMGKKVTVEKVKDVQWQSPSYYDDYEEGTGYYMFTLVAKNGAQQIELPIILSDYNENLAVEEYSYTLNGTSNVETVRDYTSVLVMEIEKGKSLKQIFPDMAAAFTFTCFYHDKLYKDVKATEVKWKDTPYWENKCDKGYYTFTLAVTGENGKQIKREFELVEQYQTITFAVSGTLKSGAGELVSGETLTFGIVDSDTADYKTKTEAGGAYRIDLPEGEWNVYWNKFKVDTITVGRESLTHNINAENMVQCSGTVSRLGKAWTDCDMEFMGDETVIVHSDAKTGAYSVYLPKDETFYIWIDDFYMQSCSTYRAEGNITKDISIDLVKISGTIYQSGTTPLADGQFHIYAEGQWEGEGKAFYTDENGKYQIYVDKNSDITIKHIDSESTIAELSVTDTDVTRDMTVGVTHVTGLLTAMNGDILDDRSIDLTSEDGLTGYVETDEEGRYSAYLKPGTYTATVNGMAECTQKLVVGSQSVVCNLQAKLYKVSGQATNNGEPWKDCIFAMEKKGAEDDGSYSFYSDQEDGGYVQYLSEGTWVIYPEIFSRESGVEIKVEGDMKKNLQFSFSEVKGHIYRKEGVEFEPKSGVFLHIQDPDGEELAESLFLSEGSDYHLYVSKPGEYTVFNGSNMQPLDTFTVTKGTPVTTHDIVCNLYKVTGSVTGIRDGEERWLCFESEDGVSWSPDDRGKVEDERMPYSIYLPAGEYQAYIMEGENPEKTTVTVNDDRTFDIAAKVTYRVSGTLSRFSKAWGGQDIAFSGENEKGEWEYKSAVSKKDGSYEVFLSPGTYDVSLCGEAVMQGDNPLGVTVTDSDISRDIEMDMIEISGKVMKNGKPLENLPISFTYTAEDGTIYGQSASTDFKGNYKTILKPSWTYNIEYAGITIDTIRTEQQDIKKDISVNVATVSGIFKGADGTPIGNTYIYFCKQGTDNEEMVSTDRAWPDEPGSAGRYSVILSPGTYDVKYNGKVVFTNLVVGVEDLQKDIVCAE